MISFKEFIENAKKALHENNDLYNAANANKHYHQGNNVTELGKMAIIKTNKGMHEVYKNDNGWKHLTTHPTHALAIAAVKEHLPT